MRISCAMYFRISETMALEQTSTKAVASPIARLLATAFVTASAEQSPSVCTSTGFSCHSPRVSTACGVFGPVEALTAMLMASPSQCAGQLGARQPPDERGGDCRLVEPEERRRRDVSGHHRVRDDGETLHRRLARTRGRRVNQVVVPAAAV